jgi:hypothetical protein
LKERVLFTPSEFHSGSKHATTGQGNKRDASGSKVAQGAIVAGSQFEGLDAGSNTQGDLVSAT